MHTKYFIVRSLGYFAHLEYCKDSQESINEVTRSVVVIWREVVRFKSFVSAFLFTFLLKDSVVRCL